MKYIELKKNLKEKLENIYLISGDDRYLCFDALKKIETCAGIQFKDLNSVTLNGDTISVSDIVESANIYPFGDNYRLLVIKNFNIPKNNQDFKILEDYLSNPLKSTIIVFFNIDTALNSKPMNNIVLIDCNKIDSKVISAFVKNELAKNEIGASEEAINTLIMYCNNDMAKITNELEKLIAYAVDSKIITIDTVRNCVTQDKEYQVFELAQYIAKNDAENAIKLVDSFMVKTGGSFQILTPLYNNYRRALFVSLCKDKTTAELAGLLGIKEFAVKMLNSQVKIFSAKQLKQIVDIISNHDVKIKNGEMKEAIAIKTVVFNILKLRGQNGK